MIEKRSVIDPQGKLGLTHILGIKDVQINPEFVDMTAVRPVIDMQMGGYSKIYDPQNERSNIQVVQLAIQSANSVDWIVSYGNHQAALNADLVYNIGHSLRIIALSYAVHIEDLGGDLSERTYRAIIWFEKAFKLIPIWKATHMINGKTDSNQAQYYNYPGDWGTETVSTTTRVNHPYNAGSANQICVPIVPATWGLKFGIYPNCLPSPDDSYYEFDALTSWEVDILALQVPHGAPIPSFW